MDGQDHKMTPTSTGHEGHGMHLCHRCGWPFPNPHPSAKHRRAHKKVCGTIEGYKIIHSEEHDDHLDDEHGSDDNEHTPSPKLVKKNVMEFVSSGGVGEKSNKSEDDVFSDAVMDFLDSGISPRLEKRFESADRTEILNDPTRSVIPITDTSAEAVSVGLVNGLQPDIIKSEILNNVVVDNVNEYSDEGIPHPALERNEELCDKSIKKLDQPPQTDESLQNLDDIAEVESASRSAKMGSSTVTVGEIAVAEETLENIDASEVVIKVSDCTEDVGEKTSLVGDENAGNVDASVGEKCDMDAFAPEDDQTIRALKKDLDHCEEKGEEASEEIKVMLDSRMPLDKSNDFPSSCEANSDSRNLEDHKPSVMSETASEIHVTSNVVIVEPLESERTSEQPVSKNSADDNSCIGEGAKASESIDGHVVVLKENSDSPTPKVQYYALPVEKCLKETSSEVEDVSTSKSVDIVSSSQEPLPSPSDDKNIIHVEHEVDDKLTKEKGDVSAISRSDSLEGNCGSVSAVSSQSNTAVAETNSHSPDTLETNSHCQKSDAFEPPSFMTLVQSGGEGDQLTSAAASEIETVQNNQQPKSGDNALEAGWFPSLTNVVNESEGRKKNEEVIAKVTNWSPVKQQQQQQHGPLKNLLNELKDNSGGVTTTVMGGGEEAAKKDDNNTNKEMEEWNSPARYPIEIKKEKKKKKKKGKSYWVPFVCCSSVHRDL